MGSLTVHKQTQHGKSEGGRRKLDTTAPGGEPQTYKMAFPNAGGARNCLVKGCQGRVATRTEMRVQFLHQYFMGTVIILEEGNLPNPQFPRCEIMVPWKALNGRNVTTAQCAKGADQKIWRLAEDETRDST